jgi:hypothetical protein
MMESKHYCASCETHFRASIEQHAETYHEGGLFEGIENGDFRDYERRQSHQR